MIYDIVHVNVNVSDIRRSIAFYEKLSFKVVHIFRDGVEGLDPSGDVMEGMSSGDGRVRGAVMSLGEHPRSFTKIELLEYVDPPTGSPSPRDMRTGGIARIALRCKDLPGEVERLRGNGIETGEIQGLEIVGASRYVLFHDPDGALLTLIEF